MLLEPTTGALNHRGSKAGPRSGVLRRTSSPAWILVQGVIRFLNLGRVRCGRRRKGPSQTPSLLLRSPSPSDPLDMDCSYLSLSDVGRMTWTERLRWFLVRSQSGGAENFDETCWNRAGRSLTCLQRWRGHITSSATKYEPLTIVHCKEREKALLFLT